MFQGKNKKQEITNIRRDLAGEKQVLLSRLAGDCGTDEGEKRCQLIWQTFRIVDCTKSSAVVLGTDHPDFAEGKEAAAGNSAELFETELIPAGPHGIKLERLSSVHSHYFGGGFERIVGQKLRNFVEERYDYDTTKGTVKASVRLLNALRKLEAKEIVGQLLDYEEEERHKMKNPVKRKPEDIASMMSSEARMERSQREMDMMQGKRPRYASTKMEPDECEDFGGMGKGGGKGSGVMPGGMGMPF